MLFSKKCHEVVDYKDKLYYVYRRVEKSMIKEGFINNVKDLWHCDLVLKNKGNEDEILIFLIEIPDAEIIED